MSPQMIGWLITGVLLLFILAGLLWGIIRGLKKTAFRGGWILITAIIVLLITPLVTRAFYGIDFSFLGLNISGHPVTTIDAWVNAMIADNADISAAVAANPAALDLIKNLPFLILDAFIFVILFWLAKIILWPVWALLAKKFFKKTDKDGNPTKRQRTWGMVVGIVIGLFVGGLTLMPVLGILDTVTSLENITAASKVSTGGNVITAASETGGVGEDNSGGVVTQFVGADTYGYISSYQGSGANYILRYTGMEWVNSLFFGNLSTINIDGKDINLKNEVTTAGKAYGDINELINLLNEDITQQSLDQILPLARSAVNNVFNSKVVQLVANSLIPYMVNGVQNEPTFFVQLPSAGNTNVDELITGTLNDYINVKLKSIQHDINCLFDAADILNSKNILISFINPSDPASKIPDGNLTTTNIAAMFDNTTVNAVIDKLFNMDSIGFIPSAIKAGVCEAADYLGVNNFDYSTATDDTRQDLKNLFSGVINAALNIVNTDNFSIEDGNYLVGDVLPYVGRILDCVKGYLSTSTYNQLIDFGVQPELTSLMDQQTAGMNLPQSLNTSLNTCLYNLLHINSFETELTKFVPVVEDLKDFVNAIDAAPDDIDLTLLGGIADQIKSTALFANPTQFNDLMCGFIDMATNDLDNDPAFAGIRDAILQIQTNIKGFHGSYKLALPPLQKLVDLIGELSQANMDLTDAGSNQLFKDIGAALDGAKVSPLMTGVANSLAVAILEMAQDNMDFSGDYSAQIEDIISSVITELDKYATDEVSISYEAEFGNMLDLINLITNVNADSYNLVSIGTSLDDIIANSSIITPAVGNTITGIVIDQAEQAINDKDANILASPNDYIMPLLRDTILNGTDTIVTFADKMQALDNFANNIADKIQQAITAYPGDQPSQQAEITDYIQNHLLDPIG